MTLFRLAGAAAALLALALALAFSATAEDAAPANLPAITVSTVVSATVSDRVYASGLIGPVETVLVQPQVQGLAIESIAAEVGDRVEAGQVLAQLSTTELTLQKSQLAASRASAEAAIAQAEAQLTEAQALADEAARVLERSKALKEKGNVSQAALDQAGASATSATARVAVARQGLAAARAQLVLVDAQIADIDLKLERTAIVAPVAGEVVERTALVGAIAAAGGAPLFTIVRDGELELMADVAETDILKLRPGQPARLTFVGPGEPVEGTVRLVEPRVDTVSRLGRVRISIADPGRVRSGMFADAEILAQEKSALVIPVSATGGGTDPVALKVQDGVVRVVGITTGIRAGGLIEVTSGLQAGDSVVTKAGAFVRDGDHINPVPAETAVQASN